jgi:hypothetical protein
MTTALSHDEAPAWLPTGEIPVQRSAPPGASLPEPAVLPAPEQVRPAPTEPTRRRWPAAVGGLAAGLAVGIVGAAGAVALMSMAPAAAAAPAPPPPSPANVSVPGRTMTAFGDGTWQIGVDIAPGTYSTAGSADADCYYALRTALTGGDTQSSTISPGPATVVLTESDGWFETFGCAAWNRVG